MQKIVSLNLNGIRAAWRKNLAAWIYNQQNLPDVICFQEIKAQIPDLSDEMINPKNLSKTNKNKKNACAMVINQITKSLQEIQD